MTPDQDVFLAGVISFCRTRAQHSFPGYSSHMFWSRYREAIGQGLGFGSVVGLIVALLFFRPISPEQWVYTILFGVVCGCITVLCAVLGGWLMLRPIEKMLTLPADRRVLRGSIGAMLGTFTIWVVAGLVLLPEGALMFVPVGVMGGFVALILGSILLTQSEQRAGTIDKDGNVL